MKVLNMLQEMLENNVRKLFFPFQTDKTFPLHLIQDAASQQGHTLPFNKAK